MNKNTKPTTIEDFRKPTLLLWASGLPAVDYPNTIVDSLAMMASNAISKGGGEELKFQAGASHSMLCSSHKFSTVTQHKDECKHTWRPGI